MLAFLPGPIRGVIAYILYFINTGLWGTLIVVFGVFKFLIPIEGWVKILDKLLNWFATNWIFVNSFIMRLPNKITWDISGVKDLNYNGWYLVISNHKSWVDILVLAKAFYRKIPFFKFFMKKELIWVPFVGIGCWALDFPFMKRYSREFLEKHQHLKGKDVEITKKACEKYKKNPVAILNFVEGTRFTKEKHRKQQSPFKHLLKPKAGGIAFVLETMGEQLQNILNVTITYPKGVRGFWGFCCGEISEIRVKVEEIPVKNEMIGDYANDPDFKKQFQSWLNDVWVEKDNQIDQLLS